MNKKAAVESTTPDVLRGVIYATILLVVLLFIIYLFQRDTIPRLLGNIFRSLRFGL